MVHELECVKEEDKEQLPEDQTLSNQVISESRHLLQSRNPNRIPDSQACNVTGHDLAGTRRCCRRCDDSSIKVKGRAHG